MQGSTVSALKSYIQLARLHRPQAIGMLMLPGWWGIAAASSSLPDPKLLFLFAVGAILMRSAGCVYNDMVDCDIDRHVTRTQFRPLAQETLTRLQAAVFMVSLLGLAAGILLFLPLYTQALGVISLALVASYPWMKRITCWPQAFLGLTFNWGALMGWSAVQESLAVPALLLYAGGFFWTLIYDTLYAHQDKRDDFALRVGSTALLFPDSPRLFLGLCACFSVVFFTAAGLFMQLAWLYFISIAGIILHYVWQIKTVNFDDGDDCARKFIANLWVGWMLFLGLVASRYWMLFA